MTMSDLKNGMPVTTRQGRHCKVARNSIVDGVPYDLLVSGRCPMIIVTWNPIHTKNRFSTTVYGQYVCQVL